MDGDQPDPRRSLPSVDAIASQVSTTDPDLPAAVVVREARREIERIRNAVANGASSPSADAVTRAVANAARLTLLESPRGVVNATGVIIHTNLGRAPLSDDALDAVARASRGYSDLELDLASGRRGSRRGHVEDLLCDLSGAEAAFVTNNNAAAVFLCLAALARGREVVVSRGEAVEIGGAFRIPEILAESGAVLVDVGTTNRTRASDYARVLGSGTALLLKVHRSNFSVVGFTEEVPLRDLCDVGLKHDMPVMNDLGSGTLIDTAQFGLAHEPMIQESVSHGAALTCFSGDKLLGGPQAGIIVGRKTMVDLVAQHPLARAVRPDKMCLAALRATLLHYLRGDAAERVPVWKMISASPEAIKARAERWGKAAPDSLRWDVAAVDSTVGGGSLPGQTLPSFALRIDAGSRSPDALASALRQADPPVIARVEADRVLLDPRTVMERHEPAVIAALEAL